MVVNSLIFWGFFLVVLILYFTALKKSAKLQNICLLIASYFFFGYSEIKMLSVILLTTAIFYYLGIKIEENSSKNPKKASLLTTIGVIIGVGMFVYFKFMNFLIDEFTQLFNTIGFQVNRGSFKIVMLLGVSYFTFKLMGYLIEINRGKMQACRDYIAFSTFVAFFPCLLAGPIDRAQEFIPQLSYTRKFNPDYVSEGLKRILWGMFMKMCIADQLCGYVDAVFNNLEHHNGTSIIVACFFYIFQSYTDFCGYSHMAVGVAQIMGIKIRENFNRPLFGQNIPELWRRWHMSLTTWVTDYIFMPLNVAFRNLGTTGIYLATFVNMVIVGSWHGASWTYVIFGLYQGVLVCFAMSIEKKRKKFEKSHNLKHKWFYVGARRLLTFLLFMVGTTIIRSNSTHDLFFLFWQVSNGLGPLFRESLPKMALVSIIIMLLKEWKDENKIRISFLHSEFYAVRIVSFSLLIVYIMLFGSLYGSTFIYYQF